MKSEYIIEQNVINPLYENTYRDIAFDLTKELDNPIIINRIVLILSSQSFGFSPITLKSIHKALFKDIYTFAGVTGDFNSVHINEEEAKKSAFGRRNICNIMDLQ